MSKYVRRWQEMSKKIRENYDIQFQWCIPSQPSAQICAFYLNEPKMPGNTKGYQGMPRDTKGTIYPQYIHNKCRINAQYMHNICKIYAQYFHNISTISSQYLHYICTVFGQ